MKRKNDWSLSWSMVVWVVKFSREGYKIRWIFGPKINILKGNYCILWIDVAASHQKLGIILQIERLKNWRYQNMLFTKNELLNLNFKWKKNHKNSFDFWHENVTLKDQFWDFFWQLATMCQFTKYNIFLEHIDFWPKIYLIVYPSLENSTTRITSLQFWFDTKVPDGK